MRTLFLLFLSVSSDQTEPDLETIEETRLLKYRQKLNQEMFNPALVPKFPNKLTPNHTYIHPAYKGLLNSLSTFYKVLLNSKPASYKGLPYSLPASYKGLPYSLPASYKGLPYSLPAFYKGLPYSLPASYKGLPYSLPAH